MNLNSLTTPHETFGLKWNPFDGETPSANLWSHDEHDEFIMRVQQLTKVGGFAMVTGTPGLGKSALLRSMKHQLSMGGKIKTNELSRPQSRLRDFYHEIGALYGVTLTGANRFGTFNRLREDWQGQIKNKRQRPLLIIDEAQELHPEVLLELRLLSSVDLDSRSIMTVVLAGDERLQTMMDRPEHRPIKSRIRVGLRLKEWESANLQEFLEHQLREAGRPDLFDPEVQQALSEQCLGNPRVLNSLCNECLIAARRLEKQVVDMDVYLSFSQNHRHRKRKTK